MTIKKSKESVIFILLRNLFTQEGFIITTAILGSTRIVFGDDVNNFYLL